MSDKMKAGQLVNLLTDFIGPLNTDEGVRFGNLKNEVTGVCVCWMATPDAINFAQEKKANFIICHEDLFLPYGKTEGDSAAAEFLSWDVNRGRIELLSKCDMTVVRLHPALDRKFLLYLTSKSCGNVRTRVAR